MPDIGTGACVAAHLLQLTVDSDEEPLAASQLTQDDFQLDVSLNTSKKESTQILIQKRKTLVILGYSC